MIFDFGLWGPSRTAQNTLSDLSNATVGIDASFYLDLVTTRGKQEPLVAALGGTPFCLRDKIKEHLQVFKKHDITPLFVFNGLDAGKKYEPFKEANDCVTTHVTAWSLYDRHDNTLANDAVAEFRRSGYVKVEEFYRVLQQVLFEEKIEFLVAPYSAVAQLSYMAKNTEGFIDALAGPTELLLFEVDKVIIDFDFQNQNYSFVKKQACVDELCMGSQELFLDACLLSGNNLIPTFPQLDGTNPRRESFLQQASQLMTRFQVNGYGICANAKNDSQVKRMDYVDRFMRARMAVKHHIVLTEDGKVEPLENQVVPNDMHDIIGQRLPDELFYYLSRGLVGTRVLNQLTTAQIIEKIPADGGDSAEYQALVRDNIIPIRASALSLLAHSLARAYQHRKIQVRCWFNERGDSQISLDDYPSQHSKIKQWCVPENSFGNLGAYKEGPESSRVKRHHLANLYKATGATLPFALQSLSDPTFASNTISTTPTSVLLKTANEVQANSLWRFLHLRGYVNDEHGLTKWGNVLDTIFSSISASGNNVQLAESAFLAVELLRLNLLNADEMFPRYSGGPSIDQPHKRHALLLCRVACLARLQHRSDEGFNGPLSRHFLGYTGLINTVRQACRDLLEMSAVSVFLGGQAEREEIDYAAISLGLPFLLQTDCGLGIALRAYLDALPVDEAQLTSEVKEQLKSKGKTTWMQHSLDYAGDLDKAFRLFDAIYEGVKVGASIDLIKGKSEWDRTYQWSLARR